LGDVFLEGKGRGPVCGCTGVMCGWGGGGCGWWPWAGCSACRWGPGEGGGGVWSRGEGGAARVGLWVLCMHLGVTNFGGGGLWACTMLRH
jgi:hypothetical protein